MTPSPAEPADAFAALRPRLFGIAYRLTGSVSDAEDICQEAWLRWHAVDHGRVTTPEAFVVRVADAGLAPATVTWMAKSGIGCA